MRSRTLAAVKPLLDNCGLPYELARGKRHVKILIAGRLAGIVAPSNTREDRRVVLNLQRHIRDTVEGIKTKGAGFHGVRFNTDS